MKIYTVPEGFQKPILEAEVEATPDTIRRLGFAKSRYIGTALPSPLNLADTSRNLDGFRRPRVTVGELTKTEAKCLGMAAGFYGLNVDPRKIRAVAGDGE